MGCCPATSAGLIQPSMERPAPLPTLTDGDAGIRSESSLPSKIMAWPTRPAANAGLPFSVPGFWPVLSLALSSKLHQPTKPGRAGTQAGGIELLLTRFRIALINRPEP